MGLVDYTSRQPNHEAKVTDKCDEEFAVATITHICDAIEAVYVNTTQQNCQSQHFCSVNHAHSTRASHPHSTNYSKLISAINRNTTQLLLENSANSAQIYSNSNLNTLTSRIQRKLKAQANSTHIHSIFQSNMTSPRSNPQNHPPTAGSHSSQTPTPP